MKTWLVFGALALGAAACGGSSGNGGSGGSASVQGQIGGGSVPTTDTIGVVGTQTTGGTTPAAVAYAGVVITNVANSCALSQGHHNPPSTTSLVLSVAVEGAAVPPGTYAVGASGKTAVDAQFVRTTATCTSESASVAASGSVTLTTVSSTTLQGSFDITMGSGEHLSGTFTGPVCAVDLATKNSPAPACGS
jgi:hypothetical protein